MDPVTGTLIGAGIEGGLGLLGGLFSRNSAKKLYAQQREDRLNTGVHALEAAKRSGFSPLTMLAAMGAGGNIGGTPDFSTPLASTQLISGAVRTAMDEFTGVNSQKRARDELEMDLAKIKLDTAKIEAQAQQVRNSSIGQYGRGRMGGPVSGQPWVDPKLGLQEAPVAPGREVQVEPQKNMSGFTTVENAITGGPTYIWGEEVGEGPAESLWAFTQMAPQIGYNWAKKWGTAAREASRDKDGKTAGDRWREGKAKAAKEAADYNTAYQDTWKRNAEKLAKQAWRP